MPLFLDLTPAESLTLIALIQARMDARRAVAATPTRNTRT